MCYQGTLACKRKEEASKLVFKQIEISVIIQDGLNQPQVEPTKCTAWPDQVSDVLMSLGF